MDVMRVYMREVASLNVVVEEWPLLAIFGLQWPHGFDLHRLVVAFEVKQT